MNDVQILQGLPGEIAAKELQLASDGYCKTRAAKPEYLEPGEYLLESAAPAVSGADGPCVRAISWRPN